MISCVFSLRSLLMEYAVGLCKLQCILCSNAFSWAQAVEAAQLAEDLKVQLEHTQAKLREIQTSVLENRSARERESGNLKRAQVRT